MKAQRPRNRAFGVAPQSPLRRLSLIPILALALLLTIASQAAAQGIVIPEPPPPERPVPIGGPIVIELHQVEAVIDGPVATVHLTQVFRNQAHWQVEGTYIFPLPEDAAISDFQMTVDGQVLEGKLLPKEKAREIYEQIVRRRRDPALLEYIGRDLFQTSVFPIPPGASRTLELTYRQVLSRQAGLFHFRYPLRTRQYTTAPVKSLAISVELRNQPGLRTIYSPSHDITVERLRDDRARVGYEATDAQPTRDFDLYFGTAESAIGLHLLSYKPAGEDGFFLLLIAPGIEVEPTEIVSRDLLLVMDVSGSMEGKKIAQAREAAHFLVDHLNPGDRFNLIAFSTGVRLWSPTLRAADAANVKAAHAWVEDLRAGGSTDINRALLEALAQLYPETAGERARPAYILFLTDGLPTMGVTDPDRIIRNALNNAPAGRGVRLFTFGVGYDVNTDLLDNLSRELGGRSSYVKPDERIDEAISHFYAQVSTPVLANISVDFGDILVEDTYPFPLPDLFAGEQLVMVGRYRQGGKTTVILRGTVNEEVRAFRYPDQRLVETGGEPFVARLWATRKIGALLAQIRREGPNQELIDTIVDLSVTYGIVTPYTSYLVLEPQFEPSVRAPEVPPAPVEMQEEVVKIVTKEVEKIVEAPASGATAVAASEARQRLETATRVEEQGNVRFVHGKTFTLQRIIAGPEGERLQFWVDNLYTRDMPLETITFGSDAYFRLAAQPDLAPWLAISPELVLVVGEKAYRITTLGEEEAPLLKPPTPTPTPTPQPSVSPPSRSVWDLLVDWLRGLFGR